MLKNFFICLVIGLFANQVISQVATAQPSQNLGTLTLEESIRIAQDQSPLAQSARFALTSSQWQFQSYRADLMPGLSISGDAPGFNRSIQTVDQDDGSFRFIPRTQSEASTSLSLDQNILWTGGTLSLSTGLTKLGIFNRENSYLWQSTPLIIGLSQPIFGFNNLKWESRLQPLQYEIAQKEYVEAMEGVAVTVTESFFNVLLAQISLENAEFNVTSNDSIYNISRGRYNVGSIAENELLQSELEFRNSEADLTSTRLEYNQAISSFKILLGYPTAVELDLDPPEELPELDVSVTEAIQLAIQNNSEALGYELSELQADRNYAQARSQAGFSATMQAQYGLNQTSENFEDLYQNPQNRQTFSVNFEVPIFNWGKQEAEVNAARNQQREVANDIAYQRRQFEQEVEYTVSQFLQLGAQVQLAARSDTIAQRRYQVAQNRYSIGNIDVTDLFQAQGDRASARQQFVASLRDFWVGWYELRQLTLFDFSVERPITYQF